MVNSHNSRSPIVVDTPDGARASPTSVIEITDTGGHSRGHCRRRRLDSTDDVIVADSPKRARVDVPVIDLTSDTEDEFPVSDSVSNSPTQRFLMTMREQVRNSRRRWAEIRARHDEALSLLPDDARQRIRRAISLRHRSSLHNHRNNPDNHHGNRTSDSPRESVRDQPPSRYLEDDAASTILVVDDDNQDDSSLLSRDTGFSWPSCSRINSSRSHHTEAGGGNSRSSLSAASRSERSRMLSHLPTQEISGRGTEMDRSSSDRTLDLPFQSSRTSRSRQHHQRRQQSSRDYLGHPPALSRNTSNNQSAADENLARNIQSAEYQADSPSSAETLSRYNVHVNNHRLTHRLPSRVASSIDQPLQPYIPDILLPAMLSFWAPESHFRHFGDSEDEREDFEALWNLTERLGQVKPKGLTKAEMEEIPAFRYTTASKGSSNGSCVVCMMDYSNREKLRRLPCNHDFHAKCIDRWLKNNRSCPVCRKEVIST